MLTLYLFMINNQNKLEKNPILSNDINKIRKLSKYFKIKENCL